jgi:hypothetical protein
VKNYLLLFLIAFLVTGSSFGQAEINAVGIEKKIKELKSEKLIYLEEPEPGWNSSKIIAVGKKFSASDCRRVGVDSMDFAAAVFLEFGRLAAAPNEILFTFRVKSKKPRFASLHSWTVMIGGETIDLGEARYAAHSKENKEFLNFKISREKLEKIAKAQEVKFKIGDAELKFSPEQMQILSNFLVVVNPALY